MDNSMQMTTTAFGAKASSTSSSMSGMSNVSHSHVSTMSMADMTMTFFSSTSTPLYSETWTPSTTGQYVGTCIFLIALAAIFRGIIAMRANFAAILALYSHRRDTSILRREIDDDPKVDLLGAAKRPWNFDGALARAVLDTILAGVSYLLMLAVMTMNVGYFMSILGGTFLGSFVIGDWTATAAMHCDAH